MADLGDIGLRPPISGRPVFLLADISTLTSAGSTTKHMPVNPAALKPTFGGNLPMRIAEIDTWKGIGTGQPAYRPSGTFRPQFEFTTKIDGTNAPCKVTVRTPYSTGVAIGTSRQPNKLSGWVVTDNLMFLVEADPNEQRRPETWGPYSIPAHTPLSLTGTFANGTVGVPYTSALTATGIAGGATWTVSGELPDGLTLDENILSGTPTLAGTFKFTVTLVDTYDNAVRYVDQVVVIAP